MGLNQGPMKLFCWWVLTCVPMKKDGEEDWDFEAWPALRCGGEQCLYDTGNFFGWHLKRKMSTILSTILGTEWRNFNEIMTFVLLLGGGEGWSSVPWDLLYCRTRTMMRMNFCPAVMSGSFWYFWPAARKSEFRPHENASGMLMTFLISLISCMVIIMNAWHYNECMKSLRRNSTKYMNQWHYNECMMNSCMTEKKKIEHVRLY